MKQNKTNRALTIMSMVKNLYENLVGKTDGRRDCSELLRTLLRHKILKVFLKSIRLNLDE
jgi:hypothetical protein